MQWAVAVTPAFVDWKPLLGSKLRASSVSRIDQRLSFQRRPEIRPDRYEGNCFRRENVTFSILSLSAPGTVTVRKDDAPAAV